MNPSHRIPRNVNYDKSNKNAEVAKTRGDVLEECMKRERGRGGKERKRWGSRDFNRAKPRMNVNVRERKRVVF